MMRFHHVALVLALYPGIVLSQPCSIAIGTPNPTITSGTNSKRTTLTFVGTNLNFLATVNGVCTTVNSVGNTVVQITGQSTCNAGVAQSFVGINPNVGLNGVPVLSGTVPNQVAICPWVQTVLVARCQAGCSSGTCSAAEQAILPNSVRCFCQVLSAAQIAAGTCPTGQTVVQLEGVYTGTSSDDVNAKARADATTAANSGANLRTSVGGDLNGGGLGFIVVPNSGGARTDCFTTCPCSGIHTGNVGNTFVGERFICTCVNGGCNGNNFDENIFFTPLPGNLSSSFPGGVNTGLTPATGVGLFAQVICNNDCLNTGVNNGHCSTCVIDCLTEAACTFGIPLAQCVCTDGTPISCPDCGKGSPKGLLGLLGLLGLIPLLLCCCLFLLCFLRRKRMDNDQLFSTFDPQAGNTVQVIPTLVPAVVQPVVHTHLPVHPHTHLPGPHTHMTHM